MVTELADSNTDCNTEDNKSDRSADRPTIPFPSGKAVIVRLSAELAQDLEHQCKRDGRNASAQLRWLIARRALELAHNSAA